MAGMIRPEALTPEAFHAEAAHIRELAAALRDPTFDHECYRQALMLYGEIYRFWPKRQIEVRVAYVTYIWVSTHWTLLAPLLERLLAKDGTIVGYRLDWEQSGSLQKEPIAVMIRVRPA